MCSQDINIKMKILKKINRWAKGVWFAILGKRIIYTNDPPLYNTGSSSGNGEQTLIYNGFKL